MKKYLITIVLLLMPLTFSCTSMLSKYVEAKQTYNSLIREVDTYIKSKSDADISAELLVHYCLKDSVPIILALAQGQLESGLGSAGRATKTKSIWNVGAWDGHTHSTSTNYKTFNDAIPAYTSLIHRRYRDMDPYKNFIDCDGKRYAADLTYERKLFRISSSIEKNTNITSLENNLKNYKYTFAVM